LILVGHLSASAAAIRFLLISSLLLPISITNERETHFDMTSFNPAHVLALTPSITSKSVIPPGKSLLRPSSIPHNSLYRPRTDKGDGVWFLVSNISSLVISFAFRSDS
jgi:hypothetical protein